MSDIKGKFKRRINRIVNMVEQSRRNPISLLYHIIRLQFTRGFLFTEIHDCELDIRGREYEQSFLNFKEQKKYLGLLNPRKYYSLARNKYLTHVILDRLGIKDKAELLCYYNPEMGSCSDKISRDIHQVINILKNKGIHKFVIKTTESSHGDNVWVIKDIRYLEQDAILTRYDDIEVTLSSILNNEPLIFETVVTQTKQLQRLNPSSVNTVRFMTVLLPNGEAKTIASFIKIGRSGSCVDNAGAGGNIDAAVDVETGKLYNSIEFNGWRKSHHIQLHPDTKAQVDGIVIENWTEIKKKVEGFQQKFPFVKAAGWDIAITQTGPVIIEVNDMWDRTGQLFIGKGWKSEIEKCFNAWKFYYSE